ncbi:glucose transporter type 3 isoform X3 [Drosophila serrata]|uniref:glucose transporter type 3 isoform X3 n=1 Tax=Drosophila serrata TaxID=7274 RepID=UPI000A1D2736|nr:glucose transporter type 3 isoform X3 [Drosophila serrata]
MFGLWPKSRPVEEAQPEQPGTSKSAKQAVKVENKPPETPNAEGSRSAWKLKTSAETPDPEEEYSMYRVNNAGLYKATFFSNIGSFLFGIAMGWSAGAEQSVMHKRSYGYTPSGLEWNYVCILLTLGAMFWCLPTGFLLRWCGCKRTILAQLLPNTLGWCLTAWGQDINMLYAGRFILGMCGGAHCVAVPIYSAEISSVRKRGIMGVCFYGACIVGVFYSFLISSFLEIRKVNLINLILVLLGLLQFLMPETPAYYVKRRKLDRAENSLRLLRGKHYNVNNEMARLTRDPTMSEHDQHQHPRQGFKYQEVRRSLARVLVLAVFHKLCGSYVFIFYSYELVRCLTLPHPLAAGLGVPALVGFLVCMCLVERMGRKHLLIVCSAIMFFATVVIGIGFKLFLENGGDILPWVTFICMPVFVGAYTAGLGTLTWLLTVELLVPPMRPLGCSIAATVNWLCASLAIFWYSSLKLVCQPYLFLVFAIIAVITLLFSLAFIPETRGMSSRKIQHRLGKQKIK